uniref:Uncharacterized protein n=1 Tax=Steinernema glaseri TaxID=37863 RepID=A0A1I7YUX4_9BILA
MTDYCILPIRSTPDPGSSLSLCNFTSFPSDLRARRSKVRNSIAHLSALHPFQEVAPVSKDISLGSLAIFFHIIVLDRLLISLKRACEVDLEISVRLNSPLAA